MLWANTLDTLTSHSQTANTIATAVVRAEFDCCNSLYFNLPNTEINGLRHIQNSLACIVANKPKYWQKSTNAYNINWSLLPTNFSSPVYLHNLISLTTDNNTRSSTVATLAGLPTSPESSHKITDRTKLLSGITPANRNRLGRNFTGRRRVTWHCLLYTSPSPRD